MCVCLNFATAPANSLPCAFSFAVASSSPPRRNVPTSYKTKSGKNLGRWINNQRSAKAKGTLKDDREVRLVSTGLKWSVLTTNSWREMLRELEIYIETQTKGAPWDGNVPTNYKIRTRGRTNGRDEERNLGRWVNRQRSLHASGKLKRERKADLDRLGLRWSVQCASSWQGMYSHLSDYIRMRKAADPRGEWDGNVPITYRTDDDPPVNLGVWVARQRSAYVQRRLKEEYVRRLESVGLKWNIHEKHTFIHEDNFVGVEYIPISQVRSVPPSARSVRTPLAEHYLRRPAALPSGGAARSAPAVVRTVSAVVKTPAVVSSAVRRPAAAAAVATPAGVIRRVPATPAVPARASAVPPTVGATVRAAAVPTRTAAVPTRMASAVLTRPAAVAPTVSAQARPASLAGATTSAVRPQGATVSSQAIAAKPQGAPPVVATKTSERPAKPANAPLLGLQKGVPVAAAHTTGKPGAPTSEERPQVQKAGLAPPVPPPKAEPTKLTTEKSKNGGIEL